MLGILAGEGVSARFRIIIGKLFGIHQVHSLGQGRPGPLRIETDARTPLLSTLCGNHDDAISSLSAIDCGGCGIFQNLHALDAGRIQVTDIAHLESVHDVQRIGGTVGRIATDADGRAGARSTGVVDYLDTGNLSLESRSRIRDRLVLEVLGLHTGNGSGDIAFPLDTIADDDDVIQDQIVTFQNDVDVRTSVHGNLNVFVTDVGDREHGLRSDVFENEVTIQVGNGADAIADQDRSTDKRFTSGVLHAAGQSDRSRKDQLADHQHTGQYEPFHQGENGLILHNMECCVIHRCKIGHFQLASCDLFGHIFVLFVKIVLEIHIIYYFCPRK